MIGERTPDVLFVGWLIAAGAVGFALGWAACAKRWEATIEAADR